MASQALLILSSPSLVHTLDTSHVVIHDLATTMSPSVPASLYPVFIEFLVLIPSCALPIFHLTQVPTQRSPACPVIIPDDPPSAPDLPNPSPDELSRIVNGDLASENLRPYLASLLIPISSSFNSSCTATVVSSRWLITAAHCIVSPNILVTVATNRSLHSQEQPFIRVATNQSHPQYNFVERQYDIGIIQLSQPAPVHAKFMKVNLDASIPTVKSFVRSVGYGTTLGEPDEGEPSSVAGHLRQVDIPVITEHKCRQAYLNYRRIIDYDAQVCAGYARGGCGAW